MMDTMVALLRSVNVGGNRMKMAWLRELATDAGCAVVRTVLATGNLVIDTPEDPDVTRQALEDALAAHYGGVDVMMRTREQLVDAMARNPWADDVAADRHEGRFVHTMFLREEPEPGVVATIGHDDSDDDFVVDGREVFILYTGGSQSSRYSSAYFERHLDVVGTARNHNSVGKILAALS